MSGAASAAAAGAGGAGTDAVQQPEKSPQDLRVLLPVPLHVHAVRIEGNECTATDHIDAELRAAGLYSAKTLKEVATRAAAAQRELLAMGLFDTVAVSLDRGPRAQTLGAIAAVAAGKADSEAAAAGAEQLSTDVTVRVAEKKRVGARAEVMTDVQTGERTLRLGGAYRNAFGRGEVVEGSVTASDNGSTRGFGLSFTKPKFAATGARLRLGAFDTTADSSRFSSYAMWSRGLRLSLADARDRHELGFEAAYREVRPQPAAVFGSRHQASVADEYLSAPSLLNVSQPASAAIVAHSHPSFKSALTYRFTVDKRDDKAAPSKGSYFSLFTELAGLGGDVDYAKAEVDAQHYIALTPRLSVGASAMGGAIRPFSLLRRSVELHRPRVSVADRFFLGGPLALRGYGPYAVGPRDTHDAIGGDTYAAFGLSASYLPPLKVTTDFGVRLHAFATAGNLIAYDEKASAADNARAWRQGLHASVGGGLVVPTPLGRFELNLVKPNVPLPGTDAVDAGTRTHSLQLGLGYRFL